MKIFLVFLFLQIILTQSISSQLTGPKIVGIDVTILPNRQLSKLTNTIGCGCLKQNPKLGNNLACGCQKQLMPINNLGCGCQKQIIGSNTICGCQKQKLGLGNNIICGCQKHKIIPFNINGCSCRKQRSIVPITNRLIQQSQKSPVGNNVAIKYPLSVSKLPDIRHSVNNNVDKITTINNLLGLKSRLTELAGLTLATANLLNKLPIMKKNEIPMRNELSIQTNVLPVTGIKGTGIKSQFDMLPTLR